MKSPPPAQAQRPILFLTETMSLGYGVAVVVHHLALHLTQLGHSVTVACRSSDNSCSGYETLIIPAEERAIRQVARARTNPIIIAHTSPFFELLPALASRYDCWAYEHGDPTPALFGAQRQGREDVKRHKLSQCYDAITGVIAISDFIRHDIGWLEAAVIYHGIDHVPDPGPKTPRLPASTAPLRVGTLMRLGSGEANYKGNSLFAKVIAQLQHAGVPLQAAVMGRGTEADAQAFREQGIEVALNSTDDQKWRFLRDLDVFISCSLWEGFNFPLVEAQAMGTAGVAFDTGSHPEVTPLVLANIGEAVTLLARYADNRTLLEEHGRLCHHFVRSRFTWAHTAQELLRLTGAPEPLGHHSRWQRALQATIGPRLAYQVKRTTRGLGALIRGAGRDADLLFNLEQPTGRSFASGTPVLCSGWCFHRLQPVVRLTIAVGGHECECRYGSARPDVSLAYGQHPLANGSGFFGSLTVPAPGRYPVVLKALLKTGQVVQTRLRGQITIHPPALLRRARQLLRSRSAIVALARGGGAHALRQALPLFASPLALPQQEQRSWVVRAVTATPGQGAHKQPLVSILMPMAADSEPPIAAAIQSLLAQSYPHWELRAAGVPGTAHDLIEAFRDARVHAHQDAELGTPATALRHAAVMARGELLAILEPAQTIDPHALEYLVGAMNTTGAGLAYADEAILSADGATWEGVYKPDYSPDYLLATNYIGSFFVLRREILERIGGIPPAHREAYGYDLLLRAAEQGLPVVHVPRILSRTWRPIPPAAPSAPARTLPENLPGLAQVQAQAQAALEEALTRRSIAGQVLPGAAPGTFRVRRTLVDHPLVSIIVPFRDRADLLRRLLTSIIYRSTYRHLEIIGISNNSRESVTAELMDHYATLYPWIHFHKLDVPFNYSRLNNFGATQASGEYLVLLNNDIEIITPEWIESLLEHAQRPEVGAVGAKLLYPDGTVQHGGVIIGLGGVAGHAQVRLPRHAAGYASRAAVIQDLSAVTAACLMVRHTHYDEVDGLNEVDLPVAFNDVDFCLRLRERGYLNIYTPFCQAYHHEAVSRGAEDTRQKQERFQGEVAYMKRRHAAILEAGDPYYNPNFSLKFPFIEKTR